MSTLKLEPMCTLRESADMRLSLLAALETSDGVRIDASAVERMDTAGLQLLVALAQQLRVEGRSLEWAATSTELRRCSQRLGLDAVLCLPVADAEGKKP